MKFSTINKQVNFAFLSLSSVSFILGIILAEHINFNFIALYLLTLCLLAVLISFKKCFRGEYLALLMFLFLGALRQINFTTLPPDDIYYLSKHRLNDVYLTGRVISQVQEGPFDKSFVFSVHSIRTDNFASRVSGKVYVKFNKWVGLNYGDELGIEGKLYDLKDKGYFNKRLIRRGIKSALFVRRRDWIAIENTEGFSLYKTAFKIKEKLKRRFDRIDPWPRDFLIAIILGDRSGLSKEAYSVFKYTGTVHILAISGLHIGIIIFILLIFLKSIRIKPKMRFVLTVVFLLFYSFMTGLRPSVVRAVIMGTTFLLSFLVKREYHVYNSLALAAIVILAIWPWQVFDIGFQLSFISVLSIVFVSPKILAILPRAKNRFIYLLQASFVISVSAWLGATPLVTYYFGMVSLISPIANVFIVGLMPFIIAGGFIYLLTSFIFPVLTSWLALSLEFMVGILLYLVIFFKSIPFAYFFVEKFPTYLLLIYYGLASVYFHKFSNYKGFSKRFAK
ncbi:ComEC/Rec2 family competence protein [Candidatus Omnitrophota bacterium]